MPLKVIIVVLLKQVFESSNVRGNLSEELKLAVVECFDIAFRNATTDVKGEFYVPESRALMGQIVFFCVNVIEKDTYRKLRYKWNRFGLVEFYNNRRTVFLLGYQPSIVYYHHCTLTIQPTFPMWSYVIKYQTRHML